MKLLKLTTGIIEEHNISDISYIQFYFDSGDDIISAGDKIWLQIPFNCVISKIRLTTDTVGSIEIDIKKSDFTNFNVFNSITGNNFVTLTNSNKIEKSDLTGWTLNILKGDYIKITINSLSNISKLNFIIEVIKEW